VSETDIYIALKNKAMSSNLDWAILHFEGDQINVIECFSNESITESRIKHDIRFGIPHLIINLMGGHKNLVFNGVELIIVDYVEKGILKNKYFNSNFSSSKTIISESQLRASVSEIEAALSSEVENLNLDFSSPLRTRH
jgi:hypothetical protein